MCVYARNDTTVWKSFNQNERSFALDEFNEKVVQSRERTGRLLSVGWKFSNESRYLYEHIVCIW